MSTEGPNVAEPRPEAAGPRKPRKSFLLVGVVLAVALGVGLFTSVGTKSPQASGGQPHQGGHLPGFGGTNLNGTGRVSVPANGLGHGTPGVLLFFGDWCTECHQELPPLAATVHTQQTTGNALAKIKVVGIDSEDSVANAKAFIKSSGVTFPVAYDPNLLITSGIFYFRGDPYAVFVNANGTINRIVDGAQLDPSSFTADEKALIPNGK